MKQTVFSIQFVMDNASFSEVPMYQVQEILQKIITQYHNEDLGRNIIDLNGNLIGQREIKENETS